MKAFARTWSRQPFWLYGIWAAALGLFILSIKSIPFQDLFTALENLHPGSLLILAGLNLVIILLLTSRWWLILRAQGHPVNLIELAGFRLAAFSIAYFTPGPQFGGEPLQVHLLRSRQGVSSSNAIASVSLDRLLELIANFSFLAVGLFILTQSGLLIALPSGQALIFTLGLLLIPIIYLVSLGRYKKPLSAVLKRIHHPKWLAAGVLVEEAEELIGAFCRQKPLTLLTTMFISLFTWIVMVGEYTLLLNFLGLAVSPAQAVIALTAARLAFIVPTPGGLGAFEASQVLAAGALGFSPLSGLAVSLVIRARDLLFAAAGLWLSAHYLRRTPNYLRVTQSIEEE
ncbi:MAG TPA: lysylphosphatidylglycerol synthase transmembrane domain-containing protein [Anaerolineales bacterium]|nr:lysylphosphatidylglycerol synthase transmembrane domain-containing protein [Anaerolineales bacterium]